MLQNYRPGVAQRLGPDHEMGREINPAVGYVSISGGTAERVHGLSRVAESPP